MVITEKTLRALENTYSKLLPDELKQYLLAEYSQEPFPHEYSEQDLYTNIERDIRAYEAGKLDVTVKSPPERWQEERAYLHNLYSEKACEVRELEDYVLELEQMLLQHGIESSKMAKRRLATTGPTVFLVG